jgi:nicotinamidase/pyrazinamidase
MKSGRKALIVVDVQNDFCPGGALAIRDGDSIIPRINSMMERFDFVIATQDWHPQNQISFASNNPGKNIYDQININGISQTLWPDHCVQGTLGAEFHDDLDSDKFSLILRKGMDPQIDSYSAFIENDRNTETGLAGYLNALDIREIFICGLATDYCVYYSALDSLRYGLRCNVIINAMRGIDVPEGNIDAVVFDMKYKGIGVVSSDELLR